tara:strand:+ start:35774 stop:36847 length:1074 start_codon:yes stop_codon:yes gene_type:complete
MINPMGVPLVNDHEQRIAQAWAGRVTGCMLGKPIEQMSMRKGPANLENYLDRVKAWPVREYIPFAPDVDDHVEHPAACRDMMSAAIPDDDINYTVISLLLLEEYGPDFTTADVGRIWLRYLPGAMVFTAEREAYAKLLAFAGMRFPYGAEPKMELGECSDNPFNDWIGAQIRTDLYGWVNPGDPERAANMAERDASLSHRGEGVYGAVAIAVVGALIGGGMEIKEALESAADFLPAGSECSQAIALGLAEASSPNATRIHAAYEGLSPVHTVNNLALVAWGLARGAENFSIAIGDTVSAGWDTDCNGATVGGLWGLTGREVPEEWTGPWGGRVQTSLSGVAELRLSDLVRRTVAHVA